MADRAGLGEESAVPNRVRVGENKWVNNRKGGVAVGGEHALFGNDEIVGDGMPVIGEDAVHDVRGKVTGEEAVVQAGVRHVGRRCWKAVLPTFIESMEHHGHLCLDLEV